MRLPGSRSLLLLSRSLLLLSRSLLLLFGAAGMHLPGVCAYTNKSQTDIYGAGT